MLVGVSTTDVLERQPVDAQVEELPEFDYIINSDNVLEMSETNTGDTLIKYKFNVYEDRMMPFWMVIDYDPEDFIDLADVVPVSCKLTVPIYQDIQSFNQIPYAGSAVNTIFNVSDIVWVESGSGGWKSSYSRMWVEYGGHRPVPYITAYGLVDFLLMLWFGDEF